MKREKPSDIMKDTIFRTLGLLFAGLVAGCAHYPKNARLTIASRKPDTDLGTSP
jgi:hypothetical protein